MKKASKVLFLLSGIFTIFFAIFFMVMTIVYFVLGGMAQSIADGLAQDIPQPVLETLYDLMRSAGLVTFAELAGYLFGLAIYFLITFFVAVAAIVLSFICKAKEYRPLPLLIVATVLCGAAWSICGIVGGILGIVNWAVYERKEVAQKAE